MNVKVKGIIQNFSFETGEQHNYLRLELPDGKVVDAFVEEDVAQVVTEAFVRQEGGIVQPARSAAVTVPEPEPMQDHFPSSDSLRAAREFSPLSVDGANEVVVFGSDEEAAPARPQPQLSTNVEPLWANAKRPEPARETNNHVAADENGYPVSRGKGRVDVSKLQGGDGEGEEDGIGQV